MPIVMLMIIKKEKYYCVDDKNNDNNCELKCVVVVMTMIIEMNSVFGMALSMAGWQNKIKAHTKTRNTTNISIDTENNLISHRHIWCIFYKVCITNNIIDIHPAYGRVKGMY